MLIENSEEVEEATVDKTIAEEPQKEEMKIANSLFPESIAHWGARTGLISRVSVLDKNGRGKNVFDSKEMIKIELEFDIPTEISTEFFSVAFSIKNTEGTDIIVKTTYDEKIELRVGEKQKLDFEFVSNLSNGDYYLVVALEDRTNAAIQYYEYIEGAYYFKIFSSKKIFGIYDVATTITY